MLVNCPVRLGNVVGRQQRIGATAGEGFTKVLANEGHVDRPVDHRVGHVDPLGPEFARHTLCHGAKPRLGTREGGKTRTAAKTRRCSRKKKRSPGPGHHHSSRFSPHQETSKASHLPYLEELPGRHIADRNIDVGTGVEDDDFERAHFGLDTVKQCNDFFFAPRIDLETESPSARPLDLTAQLVQFIAVPASHRSDLEPLPAKATRKSTSQARTGPDDKSNGISTHDVQSLAGVGPARKRRVEIRVLTTLPAYRSQKTPQREHLALSARARYLFLPMAFIQQFFIGLVIKLPDWLLLRLSGAPQRHRDHRRLLPAFQFLCAMIAKTKPVETFSPPEARAMQDDSPIDLDLPVSNPPTTKNHCIAVDGGEIILREYTPADASGPLPALVYFHGGGWVIGNIQSHEGLCSRLASVARCRVFSVGYRLAPEYKFPIPLQDCEAAFTWVSDNAASLGVLPDRIAAGGDSAGGNLTAALCISRKAAGKPLPCLQLLIYPATDMNFSTASYKECATGLFLTLTLMEWFRSHYLHSEDERNNPLASPLLAPDLNGHPPAIVVTAGFDPLSDEGSAYADRLKATGVPVTTRNYDSLIHGFANMSLIPEARAACNEIATLLRDELA